MTSSATRHRPAPSWRWGSLLALLLAAASARAQAPTWALATSGNNAQSSAGISATYATATDPATGNVYVTGEFTGTVSFGSVQLTSATPGAPDLFVAKWDVAAGAWTSAVRGGGPGMDYGQGIAVASAGGVASVYVTGTFASDPSVVIAGTPLPGAGNSDLFVAKYTDAGAGLSATNGGALSGGGNSPDKGTALAVLPAPGGGTSLYVTGFFYSNSNATIAGTALSGAGDVDVFVARFQDPGTGLTATGGTARSEGGPYADVGYGVAVVGSGSAARLYVTGSYYDGGTLAGTALTSAGARDVFVAKYTDAGSGAALVAAGAVGGGGPADDSGNAIAALVVGATTRVYVTGYYRAAATLAGTALTSAGDADLFVAKYLDPGTGLTATGGGAVGGGGPGVDTGAGIVAAPGTGGVPRVYVSGVLTDATIAGTALAGTGLFVAKYLDAGTALSGTGGGAIGGGGAASSFAQANGMAIYQQRVYVVGTFVPPATFGSTTLANPAGSNINLLLRVDDPSLNPLATRPGAAGTALRLYPNPAPGAATLTGAAPGAAMQVLDALGRVVLAATADATGTARLGGLAPGVYVVRAGSGAVRLVVQ